MKRISLTIICFFLFLLFSFHFVFAYKMSSSQYRIQTDSVNISGGRQVSNNYIIEDTTGEISSGASNSVSYKLKAGYQQMNEVYLSLSLSSHSVLMSPDIGGVSGGQSEGATSITAITDSASGYSLYIKSDNSPAMATSSLSFADYTPAVSGTPDYSWLIASTDSEFGFTVEGDDIVQEFKDNGSVCNTGSNSTSDKCWYNFTTSNNAVSQSYSANHPSGTSTILKFKAESGNQHIQVAGDYTASIIITVISN